MSQSQNIPDFRPTMELKTTELIHLVIDKKLINFIKCDVCEDILVHPQVLRPCGHICCLTCTFLKESMDSKTPHHCPVTDCKMSFNDSDVIK